MASGVEAGADHARAEHVAQEQKPGGEDDERNRELNDDERAEEALPGLALQVVRHRRFDGLQRRQQSAGEGREGGQGHRIERHTPIRLNDKSDGNRQRERNRGEEGGGETRHRQADGRAEAREQEALHQQLLQQTATAGPDGNPDGHFAAARGGPRQQEARDVDAGDEEH